MDVVVHKQNVVPDVSAVAVDALYFFATDSR